MKTFQRHRTLDELKALCAEKSLTLNTDRYDRDGSDYVLVSGGFAGQTADVLYCTVNGRFFGTLAGGRKFTETAPCDGQAWFDAILDLVYVPGPEAAHG